jgi:hypothetical protein
MPSTTKRIPRIPGTTSDRRTTKSRPQLKIGKRSTNAAGLSKYGQLQCRETIPPPCSTRGLDLTGLKLEIITGYEIIARYGVNGEFSLKEKIRALMLYKCIRHLPGYIEKEFDDVNKAMCHVFRETDRLIKHTHGFIIDDNTRNKIPDCYSLQIIYETFENHFDGRWQSYCNVKNITKNDLPLRKAIIMCLHLVIYDFHFTLFDKESTYNTMSVEDWLEWQYDQATDRLNEEKNEFFKKTGTKFKLSKHGDSEEGTDVIEALEHINEIDAFAIKRKKEIQPMQNRIRDAKPNLRFIKKQAERLKGTEVSIWLNHIVTLKENGF